MTELTAHPFPLFVRDLPQQYAVYQLLYRLSAATTALNANLLLYSIWFALTEQGRLRRPEFKKLYEALYPWHERVVMALRRLADLTGHLRILRQWIVNEAEMANQMEQQILAQTLLSTKKNHKQIHQQLADASHNLAMYYKIARVYVDADIRRDTLALLLLFFPDCTDESTARSFDRALNAARLDDGGYIQFPL